MKKAVLLLVVVSLLAVLTACGSKDDTKLVVGATAIPHAEILNHIAPALEKEGIKLEVKEFSDYVLPNTQLDEKQLDANFFQHKPYLDSQIAERGLKLVSIGNVHVEPFGAYSNKIKSIDELADGATIAIPNDASNGGRALLLLEKQGLIKLKGDAGLTPSKNDIVDNPKQLKIKELAAEMLPRVLDEVELALINTNYALLADLNPMSDALFIEDKDSPYANILVTREDNKDSDAIKKLMAALQSDDVKKFIEDKYEGSIVPAF